MTSLVENAKQLAMSLHGSSYDRKLLVGLCDALEAAEAKLAQAQEALQTVADAMQNNIEGPDIADRGWWDTDQRVAKIVRDALAKEPSNEGKK